MIVYDPHLTPSLRDFGLNIPLEKSRWERTFQELQEKVPGSWHYLEQWAPISKSDLYLAHHKDYIEQLFQNPEPLIFKAYEGEKYLTLPPQLPLSHLIQRVMGNISGTLTACELALSSGWAYAMGGGMHHAFSFGGQGFCLLNDVVLALRILQKRKKIKRALIIDVDVHKGDGTAEITFGDDSIYTVSFHGANTWPLVGGQYSESFLPNDCDRPLRDSREYLEVLQKTLGEIPQDFDLCLVVQGADPFIFDELESSQELNLTLEEMFKRDQLIHQWLSAHSIPQAYCMGGGYGKETWKVYFYYLSWALKEGR